MSSLRSLMPSLRISFAWSLMSSLMSSLRSLMASLNVSLIFMRQRTLTVAVIVAADAEMFVSETQVSEPVNDLVLGVVVPETLVMFPEPGKGSPPSPRLAPVSRFRAPSACRRPTL